MGWKFWARNMRQRIKWVMLNEESMNLDSISSVQVSLLWVRYQSNRCYSWGSFCVIFSVFWGKQFIFILDKKREKEEEKAIHIWYMNEIGAINEYQNLEKKSGSDCIASPMGVYCPVRSGSWTNFKHISHIL
jgi:hypothetical protein